ncbi:hypothetical protein JCM10207_007036 [Rhodosporidiobolus poonsookiae]
MYGGSVSAGGRWGLGAKTFRAPTDAERRREAEDRFARERERRQLHEIKVERANARAIGLEMGLRSPFLGASLGRSPRLRSASFSGMRSPALGGLGTPVMGGLGTPVMEGMGMGMGVRGAGAELGRVRSQRRALEAEAIRRERTASAIARERAGLAIANERLLASPRLSPVLSGLGVPGMGMGGGLRRSRSWSGAVPHGGMGMGMGMHASPRLSPRVVPVPVPVPVGGSGFHTPRIGGSPRLGPVAGRMSPRLMGGGMMHHHHGGNSPRVVNYNTYNVSPHLGHGMGGGAGHLGMMDDLAGGGIDPLVLDGGVGPLPGSMPAGHHHHNFVVTDLPYDENGRSIIRELGLVEGVSSGGHMLSEDDRLSLAIANLTANAQSMGANGVLEVETGEDVGGQIVVRGRAVVLS